MYRDWPGEVAPNIILVDKPAGMTSFDVIRYLRSYTGVRKFGHAGTLDPAATGLLLLGVEAGTKQLSQYLHQDKVYEAEILLGQSRTTDDMDGTVLELQPQITLTEATIIAAVASLVGEQTLPVSSYSAIKRDGVPMYKRARQAEQTGTQVTDVPTRTMRVHKAQYHALRSVVMEEDTFLLVSVTFSVAAGTYIRSLAVELGRRLECPATLYGLRRTQLGEFTVDQAVSLEAYKTLT